MSVVSQVRAALPRGRTLPDAAWARRHRWMLVLLWAHVPALVTYALLRGQGVVHALALHGGALAAPALLAQQRGSRRVRSCLVVVGLLTASALAVHTSGGLTEAHFHFFVMVVVISLYEDWMPFLVAVAYVVLHHGVGGMVEPGSVFSHPDAVAHPLRWAAIHAAFVLAAGAAAIVSWRLNEDVRAAAVRARERAERDEERFRRSFENAPIGMALTGLDGRWLGVNRALCEMTGYSSEQITGSSFLSITHPDDRDDGTEDMRRLASGEALTVEREKRYVHADGHTIWASLKVSVVRDAAGRAHQLIAQIQDITQRRHAELEAARRTAQQARVAQLGELALSGIAVEELSRHAVDAAAEVLEVRHCRLHELVARSGRLRCVAAHGEDLLGGHDAHSLHALAARAPVVMPDAAAEKRFDARMLAERGVVSGVSVAVADRGGETFGALAVHADHAREFTPDDVHFLQALANILGSAIQRTQSELDLRHQSLHDPLTGLANRALFLDRLEHALAGARRGGGTLAVIFIDLDNFKVINDSLGHQAGDLLLTDLAPRLRGCLRDADTLARFGGDEFVLLCEDLADAMDALLVAERLRSVVAEPFQLGTDEHFVSASIGVALSSPQYFGRPEALLRDADAAMYQAKAAGRNRIELFDEVMRVRILDRLATQNGLRRALDRGELRLCYQPLVTLADERTTRCEALLRWQHPQRGLLAPGAFMTVAEETGLILPIGEWVLDEACRQAAEWAATRRAGLAELKVGVNVSALQIAHGDLPAVVAGTLERHRLPADRLVLEITETALISDPDGAARTLTALRELGVDIALDDFGTGFSSLISIKQYPLTAIKLDRTFIAELAPGSRDAAIVASLITMARSLGLGTVAEGVETRQQLDLLRALGCDVAQGFLFARPLPAAEFAAAFAPRGLKSVS